MHSTTGPRIRTPPCGLESGLLSPNMRRLLERMRKLGFGTIRGLHVRAGEPLFDPRPVVVRTVLVREAGAASPRVMPDVFTLSREQVAFVHCLASMDEGVIDMIKIHDGLPVSMEIHEPA